MSISRSISLLSCLALAAAQSCTLQFDGRVPAATKLADFDAKNALFNEANVIGANLKFSKVLQLPTATGSLFDTAGATVPLEVTIDDKSIFNNQTGFRRAELLAASNNGTDASTTGVKTLHWSLMKDAARPLNTSHEYQLVFLEDAKFNTNQFVLKTGTILDQATADPDTLQVIGNVNAGAKQLFSTPFTANTFHNFAVTLDFNKNTTQVFYSTGTDALQSVTDVVANDVSGQGQFHFGVLKKGVNGGADITKNATQPAGINEGVIYGGIFEEDSSAGCVSLSANATAAGSATSGTKASKKGSKKTAKRALRYWA